MHLKSSFSRLGHVKTIRVQSKVVPRTNALCRSVSAEGFIVI